MTEPTTGSPDIRPDVIPGWACKLHGEGTFNDGCSCVPTELQAALRVAHTRLDDQVKINVQLKKDMHQVREIAEARRRTVASLQRQVDTYALALKSVDNAVNLTRKALREETGGRDRFIDVKSMSDPHERVIDSNGQELVPTAALLEQSHDQEPTASSGGVNG